MLNPAVFFIDVEPVIWIVFIIATFYLVFDDGVFSKVWHWDSGAWQMAGPICYWSIWPCTFLNTTLVRVGQPLLHGYMFENLVLSDWKGLEPLMPDILIATDPDSYHKEIRGIKQDATNAQSSIQQHLGPDVTHKPCVFLLITMLP